MKILYINDELATGDGSNYHALGIFQNLTKLLGKEHVRSYPTAMDGSAAPINQKALAFREKHKHLLQPLRLVRKTLQSHIRSRKLIQELKADGFTPTHVLARSVLFDTTAISVAKHFSAKLIYEVNTPMYYEHCVLNKLPLQRAVEYWERRILEKSHGIYAVSAICRDMLCEHYRISAEKFVVIPNGYMEELYPPTPEEQQHIRTSVRTAQNMTDKFVVTFIGSLKGWHGIDRLCEIAGLLEENPRIHFLVAGDGSEHALIEEYCKLHTNMTYKGKLSLQNMAGYLFASDLGIMPYHAMDNFYFSPLKMYDMIGAGLPFLGTRQGQIQEFCETYLSSNFLLPSDLASETAKKILLLSGNPILLTAMREQVLSTRPYATWQARVQELIQYLKSRL